MALLTPARVPVARLDPWHALVSPAVWLATAHLLLDAAVAAVVANVVGFGLLVSAMLLPVAMIGAPVFVLTARLSAGFAAFERARYRALLGVELPAQPLPPRPLNPVRSAGVLVRDIGVRRRLAHQLVAVPLGALLTGLMYITLVGGVALLIAPLLVMWFGTPDTMLLGLPFTTGSTGRTLVAGAGLILLLLAPAVVRGLATVDATVATRLLGGSLAERVGELERSRARVVDAGEAERRRIERDLHDGTQQQLVALGMTLGRAKSRYRKDPEAIGELLDDAHQQAKDAVVDLRHLIRGLHPPVLSDRGLDAALSAIAARCPVPVDLSVELAERPPAVIEAIGYFVVAEALTNVAKHAKAAAATVVVRREPDGPVWITISDNGVGGADADRGTGLRGLADRVSGVDGQLHVDSPVGGPTVLTVELPVTGGGR